MKQVVHGLALALALALAWWSTDAPGPFAVVALWVGSPFAFGWVVAGWVVPQHRRLARAILGLDGLALLVYAGLAYVLPIVSGSPFDGVLSLAVAPVQAGAVLVAMLMLPAANEPGK